MFKQLLAEKHKLISQYLSNFLDQKKKDLSIHSWSEDIFDRLSKFAIRGKMVRGGLVLLTAELFAKENQPPSQLTSKNTEWLKVAAAVELFQSGLLIHDDIMDNDYHRRGQTSIFAQYQQLATNNDYSDPANFGLSAGICGGDICFFLCQELISSLLDQKISQQLNQLFAQELTSTALAQIKDVELTLNSLQISQKDILDMYRLKTGRYTFSVPFMTGAILAKQPASVINTLSQLGEEVGLIFQIKDDEISLFGKTEKIGKPVGSDIRENKKTIYWHHLIEKTLQLNSQQKNNSTKDLQKLFGKQNLTDEEIEFVGQQIKVTGVLQIVDKLVNTAVDRAHTLLDKLSLSTTNQHFFEELISYNLRRKK